MLQKCSHYLIQLRVVWDTITVKSPFATACKIVPRRGNASARFVSGCWRSAAAARGNSHALGTCALAAFVSLRRSPLALPEIRDRAPSAVLVFAARELAQLHNRTQIRLLVFTPRIGERVCSGALFPPRTYGTRPI